MKKRHRTMECPFQYVEMCGGRYLYRCVLCGHEITTERQKPPSRQGCTEAPLDCRNRGEMLRQDICRAYGDDEGTAVDVFGCSVHGVCVKRQHQTPASMMDCVRCMASDLGFKRPTFPRVIQDDCDVVAVTSLAPNDRAMDALQSWQDAGLHVVAVQPRHELATTRAIYGELVDEYWATDNDARETFGRPCVFIWELAQQAVIRDRPIMLINSDIEISGHQREVIRLSEIAREHLVIGVRHNYDHWRRTRLEKHGLDVFFLPSTLASSLPRLPLAMGIPFWDYWIPAHACKIGMDIEMYAKPLFFHRWHGLSWTGDDWQKANKIAQDAGYDFGVIDDIRSARSARVDGIFPRSAK